jgi:probable DNA metabolism protein
MIEYTYDGTLEGLFAILDRICQSKAPEAVLPDHVRASRETAAPGGTSPVPSPAQPDLFAEAAPNSAPHPSPFTGSTAAISDATPDIPAAQYLYEFSANAYERFIHGWMSELPIEAELIRFAWRVLAAGLNTSEGLRSAKAREAAEAVAADRGDPDVRTVLDAAYKVWRELDRLRGLLRFSPESSGIHIARCTPDHFVLPGLAGHFTRRFGEMPWAIIDERRGLALIRYPGEEARLLPLGDLPHSITGNRSLNDPWEDLWRNYHRVVANESRINPQLQRQFMPKRYWKYLPELRE